MPASSVVPRGIRGGGKIEKLGAITYVLTMVTGDVKYHNDFEYPLIVLLFNLKLTPWVGTG